MIKNFITEVKNRGLARSNRFRVFIPFPGVHEQTQKLTQLFCDNITLPGMNIATTPHRISGEAREYPYERTFDNLQMSFYVDTDFDVRAAFERWIHSIVDQQTRSIAYYKTYVKDIKIFVDTIETAEGAGMVPRDGGVSVPSPYVIDVFEAYPKSVQSMQLDAGSRDVMKLNVIMQYKYWKSSVSDNVLINNERMRAPTIPLETMVAQVGPGSKSSLITG